MNDNSEKIKQLNDKVNELLRRQESFSKEINELKAEIDRLQYSAPESPLPSFIKSEPEDIRYPFEEIKDTTIPPAKPYTPPPVIIENVIGPEKPKATPPVSNNRSLEKFIGENLINKIGIVITVIGVAIGAKYAIDHDMISPLTRILLGYLIGIGLMVFAIKLKKDYEKFSAVLVSGSMAILYFITFAGFAYYQLMIREVAFGLMFLFTVFTVYAAIQYNQQVIALIGLVGAYAVPFLLSNNSGQAAVLFTYMAIINSGIAVLSFRKKWLPVYYSSFVLTWVIFLGWYFTRYTSSTNYATAAIFVFIFFAIFYATFLAYKLIRVEKLTITDVIALLINSFIFYGIGYDMLESKARFEQLTGVFTLGNGIIHFIVSVIIHRRRLGDKNPLYLVAGLVLTFITITIPVQLDGNWVTLMWTAEAAVLFWVGRTKSIAVYEKISSAIMLLAFFSMMIDWGEHSRYIDDVTDKITPFLNITFLTSILFSIAFGFMAKIRLSRMDEITFSRNKLITNIMILLPIVIFVVGTYMAFHNEIDFFFHHKFYGSKIILHGEYSWLLDEDYIWYLKIWSVNFMLLYIGIINWFVNKKIKSKLASEILAIGNIYALFLFIGVGFNSFGELRHSYLVHTHGGVYFYTLNNILIRYISIPFALLGLFSLRSFTLLPEINTRFKKLYDFFFHFIIVALLSNELIHWTEMSGQDDTYNIWLSILWGVYSLFLIGLGIKNKKKHIRLAAIALFAITLLKLFFYDISDLSTIAKTVVFVLLGILLLVISFLYNKYKHYLADE